MIEVLKQMVKALECALSEDKPYIDECKQAIQAGKQAIAKLESQEPVAFKIYKPTPPRHAIPNVRDAELPWVYDQDPSSGNVASMWVTPVKHTHPPQRTEQETVHGDVLPPVGSRVYIRHGRDDDAHACTVVGYFAWPDLGGNKNLHRVFVRLVYEGTDRAQARFLSECWPTAEAALATPPAQRTWVGSGDLEDSNAYLNTEEKNNG